MSSRRGGNTKGPPKHQNSHAWKPNAGVKRKDKELGGKSHPFPAVTDVCNRCKEQIEWRRKYGKYKPLVEPAKCNQCGKRAVKQAYHTLCSACALQRDVCAKCCHWKDVIVGRTSVDDKVLKADKDDSATADKDDSATVDKDDTEAADKAYENEEDEDLSEVDSEIDD